MGFEWILFLSNASRRCGGMRDSDPAFKSGRPGAEAGPLLFSVCFYFILVFLLSYKYSLTSLLSNQ